MDRHVAEVGAQGEVDDLAQVRLVVEFLGLTIKELFNKRYFFLCTKFGCSSFSS